MLKEGLEYLQHYETTLELLRDNYSTNLFDNIINKLNNSVSLNNDDINYLLDWDENVSQFHKIRLEVVKYKQTYFIQIVHAAILNFLAKNMDHNNLSLIDDKINELGTQLKKWMHHKDTFQESIGQQQKANRIYSYSAYFKAVAALKTALGKPPNLPKPISYSFNYAGFQVLNTLFNSSIQENSTPFTLKLNEYFQSLALQEGITVKLLGQENLKYVHLNDNEHNIVNLFLPSHRSPVPDAIVLGHLNLPHYILFANLGSTIPDYKFISEKISLLPEVISIGRIKNNDNMKPYDKLILSLKNKISPNVINYPQGFVPSTGEVLPINPVFVEKLLVPLIYNKFIVKIIPVSYEVGTEFLFDKPDHQGLEYTIKYGQPLEFNTVKTLVKFQLGSIIDQELDLSETLTKELLDDLLNDRIRGNGPRYFDHYMLTHWYENITEYKELTLEEMIIRAENRLGLNLKI